MIMKPAIPADYAWIAQRADITIRDNFRAIKAIDASGKIHGMVGYDGWTPNAACIHVAVDNPLALRTLILPGFRIPFLELGKKVLIASIVGTNAKSLALAKRLGFVEVMRGRGWYVEGADLVWLELRKENCKWLEGARKAA